MKYCDTYRIVTQVSRYVSHRDFRYRAAPIGHRLVNDATSVNHDRKNLLFFKRRRRKTNVQRERISARVPSRGGPDVPLSATDVRASSATRHRPTRVANFHRRRKSRLTASSAAVERRRFTPSLAGGRLSYRALRAHAPFERSLNDSRLSRPCVQRTR